MFFLTLITNLRISPRFSKFLTRKLDHHHACAVLIFVNADKQTQKKRLRHEGAADQQSKNHILQKEYSP